VWLKGSCETKNMKPRERLFDRNKTLNKSLEKGNWPCIFSWDFYFWSCNQFRYQMINKNEIVLPPYTFNIYK